MDVQAYKRTHRPTAMNENDKGKPHQGIYVPNHPEKVVGGEIITRSSWEMAFARWCDDNTAVVRWGCETVPIQYRNPAAVDLDACHKFNVSPMDPNNWPVHTYMPDFYVELKEIDEDDNETLKKMLIEIKPKCQTERPIPPPVGAKLQDQKRFNTATRTYLQNIKKWEAAKAWAQEHDIEFKVFTEVTLQSMGLI